MDVVPMITLSYYSICSSSPAKDSQEKNRTQKVKELALTEKKKKQQIKREKFFFSTKRRD